MKKLVKKQNGGAASQIKSGVKQVAKGVKKGVNDSIDSAKSTAKAVVKASPEYKAYKAAGSAMKSVDDSLQKRYPNYTGKGSAYDTVKKGVKSVMGYKTGGMVNSNAKATVSKSATGKVGGISKAPKTAVPKAKYGMSMRKK